MPKDRGLYQKGERFMLTIPVEVAADRAGGVLYLMPYENAPPQNWLKVVPHLTQMVPISDFTVTRDVSAPAQIICDYVKAAHGFYDEFANRTALGIIGALRAQHYEIVLDFPKTTTDPS